MPQDDSGSDGKHAAGKAEVPVSAGQILKDASLDARARREASQKLRGAVKDEATKKQLARQSFEDRLRRDRRQAGLWLRYAAFEAREGDEPRARSIYERALDAGPYVAAVYLRYAEFELAGGHIGRMRNVMDRAVGLLPRADDVWHRYAVLEETHGDAESARAVYDRWLRWASRSDEPWRTAARFERRCGSLRGERSVFIRMAAARPGIASPLLLRARFEEDIARDVGRARAAYEKALSTCSELDAAYFGEFARFEARSGEDERARMVYAHGIARFPEATSLRHSAAAFERRSSGDDVGSVLRARTLADPRDYDAWLLLALCAEASLGFGGVDSIRDVYEKGVAQTPPEETGKDAWRRYVWLWLAYAAFEETTARDIARAHGVYIRLLAAIPHARFTFSKAWISAAASHLRSDDVATARRTLGRSLGCAPRPRVFRWYIELETRLRDFSRVRTLCERFVECFPRCSDAWTAFADVERLLGDDDRARAILDAALALDSAGTSLDDPCALLQAYIDAETEIGDSDRVRGLYERMLVCDSSSDTWSKWARYEASLVLPAESDNDAPEELCALQVLRARKVLSRACMAHAGNARLEMLALWRDLETQMGSLETDLVSFDALTHSRKSFIPSLDGEKSLFGRGIDVIAAHERPEKDELPDNGAAIPVDAEPSVASPAAGLLASAAAWKRLQK